MSRNIQDYLIGKRNKLSLLKLGKEISKEIISYACKYTITDIDLMSGKEFEKFVADLFDRMRHIIHKSPKTLLTKYRYYS